jgi:hypothetical protein
MFFKRYNENVAIIAILFKYISIHATTNLVGYNKSRCTGTVVLPHH